MKDRSGDCVANQADFVLGPGTRIKQLAASLIDYNLALGILKNPYVDHTIEQEFNPVFLQLR